MTHTEATHNLVFSFNDLLDAMPADAQPADAAALATLFSNACVNADDADGAQAFTGLSHQLMASQQRRDARQQPAAQQAVVPAAPQPQTKGTVLEQLEQMKQGFSAKAVRPEGCCGAAKTVEVPPAPKGQEHTGPGPLIETILTAMAPQIEAEADRRIKQILASRQPQAR